MHNFKFPKYSDKWLEISRKCKIRDNFRCTHCNKAESASNRLHVHHIISKSKNGRDDLANLRTLCENCHMLRHSHMKLAKKRNNNGQKKAFIASREESKIF